VVVCLGGFRFLESLGLIRLCIVWAELL